MHIDGEECEQVVRHLMDNMPEGLLLRIYEETHKPPDFMIFNHFGFGIEVLDLLRSGSLHGWTRC